MNTTKWTLMVMACMVIVPMAMQEAYPAVITVTDPGGSLAQSVIDSATH
jgi:hypothetical protein